MGHASVGNLNQLLIRFIYAKGQASIHDCVERAKLLKEPVHAGEGDYLDDAMLSLAFSEIILFHARPWCENKHRPDIEPVPQNDAQKALIEQFNKTGLSDICSDDISEKAVEQEKEFESIPWRFTKGTRTMYITKTIPAITYFEN